MSELISLKIRGKIYEWRQPLVMGILNVTPDSFSDGGRFFKGSDLDLNAAVENALQMVEDGADIIDIGGESSGPDSKDVSLEEELARVIPVVKKFKEILAKRSGGERILLSVDTYKAEVAEQSLDLGVDIINDVTALRGDPEMAKVLAKCDVPIVVMYSKDSTARTTRSKVEYKNVIETVENFLEERIEYGVENGIDRGRFIIDPGMGAFISGDSKYSLQILNQLREFGSLGLPILIGASRKGFTGNKDQRLAGSLACAAIAVYNGASILRVHDVKETRQVVDMAYAIRNN